jgi:hypothetical protein
MGFNLGFKGLKPLALVVTCFVVCGKEVMYGFDFIWV